MEAGIHDTDQSKLFPMMVLPRNSALSYTSHCAILGYFVHIRTASALQAADSGRVVEQQAIPRAAIPDCTNHFSVVNTLGESGFDSACSIEGFQLFGGEFHIQTGEIFLELRYLPRSNDRDYWRRLMEQPGECDLRHAATGLFGNRLYSRYHRRRPLFPLRKEGFHSLIGHPPAVGLAFAVIFPG